MSERYSNKFSVIMAVRLRPYPNQAQFPEAKFRRSVKSVLSQSFSNFEFIIVSDGCDLAKRIVKEYKDERIRFFMVNHNALFDNGPRNHGIKQAKGEYIIYCDADDYWGEDHLQIISKGLVAPFVYYNDLVYDTRNEQWIERSCNLRKMGQCGTSNICHASSLELRWERTGYAHDYYFIQQLLKFEHKKCETSEYFVCHVPGAYDL